MLVFRRFASSSFALGHFGSSKAFGLEWRMERAPDDNGASYVDFPGNRGQHSCGNPGGSGCSCLLADNNVEAFINAANASTGVVDAAARRQQQVRRDDQHCLCGQLFTAIWTAVHCHVSLPVRSSD